MDLKNYIASIPDFPSKGILFRDVTPLLADSEAFAETIRIIADYAKKIGAEVVVGPESRGFIFGCPVAYGAGMGFVPVRKPGKLPRETVSFKYDLEYGSNELFIHADAIKKGQKVLIVDDLLATGGTMKAAAELVESLGGKVVKIIFIMELAGLKGREQLAGYDVDSVIVYPGK